MDHLNFSEDEMSFLRPQLRFMEEMRRFVNDEDGSEAKKKRERSRKIRQDLVRLYLKMNRRACDFLLEKNSNDVRDLILMRRFVAGRRAVLKKTLDMSSSESTPNVVIAVECHMKNLCKDIIRHPKLKKVDFSDVTEVFKAIWQELKSDFMENLMKQNLRLHDRCNVM